MTLPRVYLDWNATAPLRPEARAAMLAALDEVGNPSSVHAEGRRARALIERARGQVAALVGAAPHNVIFTGSATEAAAHALSRHWRGDGVARPAGRLFVSAIEHPCVLAGGQFAPDEVVRVAVTSTGIVDVFALDQHLKSHNLALGKPLVALMLANNETGVIQPVAAAAALVHAAGGFLVCDAVQAAGRIPIDLASLGADALFLSAHKLGGPKGVGALVLADEAVAPAPFIRGGGQERGHRAGTENVAAIAGFGAAAEAARAGLVDMPRIAQLRGRIESVVRSVVARNGSPRLPNTTLLTLPGGKAETLVIQLDLAGIAVSAGSACSSGKVKRSHVLEAMGLAPEIADGTIRISLGATTTEAEVERFVAAWGKIVVRRSA